MPMTLRAERPVSHGVLHRYSGRTGCMPGPPPPPAPARARTSISMRGRRLPFFWRLFVASALVLVVATVLLIVTPITISANIALVEVVVLLAGLCAALLV